MLITKIVPSETGNEYTIYDETCAKYILSAADFKRLKITYSGDESEFPKEVSDNIRNELSEYAEKLRCVKYLQWYIQSYGEKSVKRLLEKCRENGYSNEISEAATALLIKYNVIDEIAACKRRITVYAEDKLFGKYRIKQELFAKGYSKKSVEVAFEDCETDFYENAVAMYAKLTKNGVPKDYHEKKKLCDKMVRYGYSYDEIKFASSVEYEQ